MDLRIKEIAKEKKMTIVALAESIGVAQPTMSNMVNGKTTPSLETLGRIAASLNVPISELFESPKSDEAIITCPHCGHNITIKAE